MKPRETNYSYDDTTLDEPLVTACFGEDSAVSNRLECSAKPSGLYRNRSRILDRSGRFHQSRGRWQISSVSRIQRIIPPRVRRLWDDWFHSLAYTPTLQLFAYLFLWYTLTICFWALIYYFVSQSGSRDISQSEMRSSHDTNTNSSFCGLDITNRMEALYFSLSTMSGIGYGVSDYYFGDCWTPFVLVLAQVLNGIAFDAVAIGLLFQRMSRGQKRGRTIIFSDRAVIKRVRDQYYFMFRIGDLRSRHIIESRVRVYCIRHERYPRYHNLSQREKGISFPAENSEASVPIETHHFVTRSVSLLDNDESLLMTLPHVVVHKMDYMSPLVPPHEWFDATGKRHSPLHSKKPIISFDNGAVSNCFEEGCNRERSDILEFLSDREIEIIILLEGTDEVSGTAVQARHSYRWDDILFDHTFSDCVYPVSECNRDNCVSESGDSSFKRPRQDSIFSVSEMEDGNKTFPLRCAGSLSKCVIDFGKFHDVVAAPLNSSWCAFIPEWAHGHEC